MNEMTPDALTRAILIWTGWDVTSWPARRDELVLRAYPADEGPKVVTEVRSLYQNFYLSDARYESANLIEMGERAAAEFRARHPEIGDEAVEALAWCYTFDYK